MKKLITFCLMSTLIIGSYSCNSTNATKKADPDTAQNEPMRDKNQADNNTPGHQKDELREVDRN